MERKIRTIPKKKMKGIKAMSPFIIEELMLLGLRLLNNKKGEENDEKNRNFTSRTNLMKQLNLF